jgi:hypothetical protein
MHWFHYVHGLLFFYSFTINSMEECQPHLYFLFILKFINHYYFGLILLHTIFIIRYMIQVINDSPHQKLTYRMSWSFKFHHLNFCYNHCLQIKFRTIMLKPRSLNLSRITHLACQSLQIPRYSCYLRKCHARNLEFVINFIRQIYLISPWHLNFTILRWFS